MQDFKHVHESNRVESSHPSLAVCMLWGIGCFAIWMAVFALAAHKLGAI